MHPILRVVSVLGHERPLSSYGFLLAVAIVVGTTISVRAARRVGFPFGDALATAGLVSGAALLGAFVLDGLVRCLASGSLSAFTSDVGLTFYGAPIAGTAAFSVACRTFEASPLRVADAAIAGVPIAHALGRIGCFLAGCCYGRESAGPLAVVFPPGTVDPVGHVVARHPVQLYEAGALLLVGGALVVFPPRIVGTGRRALGYVAAYAIVRLITERFRGDPTRGVVGHVVSTSDLIAVATLVAAIALWPHTAPGGAHGIPAE